MAIDGVEIRRGRFEDFSGILSLYKKLGLDRGEVERDPRFLKWLYSNCSDGLYGSFVAVKGEIVVGHIGCVTSFFSDGSVRLEGIHPMDWIVDPEFGSGLGLLLFEKWIEMGDFQFIIGGNEHAQKMYPFFKFGKKDEVAVFFRALSPLSYSFSGGDKVYKKVAKFLVHSKRTIISSFNRRLKDRFRLEKFSNDYKQVFDDGYFSNIMLGKYIEWLIGCPNVEVLKFRIGIGGEYLGPILGYIREVNGIKNGKLLYVPPVDDEVLLKDIIILVEREFIRRGCVGLYTGSNYPKIKKVLKKLGYSGYKIPLWIRDMDRKLGDKKLLINSADGDTGYRGF